MRDSELWLKALRGERQPPTTSVEREAHLLRGGLLKDIAVLNSRSPAPSVEGYAVIRARVHQERLSSRRKNPRRALLTFLGTVSLLALVALRTVTLVTLPVTRGANGLADHDINLNRNTLLKDLKDHGGKPIILGCWRYSWLSDLVCLPRSHKYAPIIAISVTATNEVEEYFISHEPPIMPDTRQRDTFFIIIPGPFL